jgi:hypothetical protein
MKPKIELQQKLQVSQPGERAAKMKARIDKYLSDIDEIERYLDELDTRWEEQDRLEATFSFKFKRVINNISALFSRKH